LEGCAICGSTWGDYWREIEGERMFFCCEICYFQFQNMIDEVKRKTSWNTVDSVQIEGDYRGRECIAKSGANSYAFLITFKSNGDIQKFEDRTLKEK
ncbi:MAG: TA0938 family protein, partial [Rhabdochlamydiaceae bacterium]